MYDNKSALHIDTNEIAMIISSLPARLYASQSGSCYVKPIAVLHLIVDGCTSHVDYICYNKYWL